MADALVITVIDAQLQGALSRAVAQLERPRDLLDSIGGVLEQRVNLRFVSKTDPDGRAWAPLAQSTRANYARKDKGRAQGSLLQRTGEMLSTLTHNTSDSSVDVGFSARKAAWHETGTRRMPRRGMLASDPTAGSLGEGDAQAVLAEVDAFIARLF